MIYTAEGLDLIKPVASYMGGFALVHVTDRGMDIVLAHAAGEEGDITFTNAFSKKFA